MTLLIAGGELDPNLIALTQAALRLDVEVLDWRQPLASSWPFHWDFQTPNEPFEGYRPTAGFIRQDVFAGMQDPRPEVGERARAWHVAVNGWLLAQADVTILNRHIQTRAFNKPVALHLAQQVGLRVGPTWISNDIGFLKTQSLDETIVKPVGGGGRCELLRESLGVDHTSAGGFSASPAIVQQRLIAPEIRVFVIGDRSFAFEMRSPSLDYRVHQDAQVIPVDVPQLEEQGMRQLMTAFGMDFGAADFKTDPATGRLCFLELNTSPMFAAFDSAVEGKLCEAMVSILINGLA